MKFKYNKLDALFVFSWTLVAFVLSLLYGRNYLLTGLFFFVIPSIYLSLRRPGLIKKCFIVSAVFTIPAVGIASYLAHTDGAWFNFAISGVRILNSYPLDDFLWALIYFYYILAVYEFFIDGEVNLNLPKKFVKFYEIVIPLTILFSLIAYIRGGIQLQYTYFLSIIVWFIVVPWTIIAYHPVLIPKIVKLGVYFLFLSVLDEYIANVNVNWTFPGRHFIGYVSIFNISFPLEEFMWLFLAVPAIVTYYEFVADDER